MKPKFRDLFVGAEIVPRSPAPKPVKDIKCKFCGADACSDGVCEYCGSYNTRTRIIETHYTTDFDVI